MSSKDTTKESLEQAAGEDYPQQTSRLPPGYVLDLVDDPCILILRDPDGAVVVRFPRNTDPDEIRRAAEEACQQRD